MTEPFLNSVDTPSRKPEVLYSDINIVETQVGNRNTVGFCSTSCANVCFDRARRHSAHLSDSEGFSSTCMELIPSTSTLVNSGSYNEALMSFHGASVCCLCALSGSFSFPCGFSAVPFFDILVPGFHPVL